jgi:hypothetical protein
LATAKKAVLQPIKKAGEHPAHRLFAVKEKRQTQSFRFLKAPALLGDETTQLRQKKPPHPNMWGRFHNRRVERDEVGDVGRLGSDGVEKAKNS